MPFPKPIAAAIVTPNGVEWVEPQMEEYPDTGWEPQLKWLKEHINGYVECVRCDGVHFWIDEEGRLKNLELNPIMSVCYDGIMVGTGVALLYSEEAKEMLTRLGLIHASSLADLAKVQAKIQENKEPS